MIKQGRLGGLPDESWQHISPSHRRATNLSGDIDDGCDAFGARCTCQTAGIFDACSDVTAFFYDIPSQRELMKVVNDASARGKAAIGLLDQGFALEYLRFVEKT